MSPDPIESHKRFRAKHGLEFHLLSDPERKVAAAYGVLKEKTVSGKKKPAIERSTFIIDEDGIVKEVFRKVKVDGHAHQVLEAL